MVFSSNKALSNTVAIDIYIVMSSILAKAQIALNCFRSITSCIKLWPLPAKKLLGMTRPDLLLFCFRRGRKKTFSQSYTRHQHSLPNRLVCRMTRDKHWRDVIRWTNCYHAGLTNNAVKIKKINLSKAKTTNSTIFVRL